MTIEADLICAVFCDGDSSIVAVVVYCIRYLCELVHDW